MKMELENRYSRQEMLNYIPKDFQRKIQRKKLAIVGCGGVGSVLSQLLVRGGFLNFIIIDNDKVDLTNLHRQEYFEEDVDEFKTKSLKKHMLKINKMTQVLIVNRKLNTKNVESIFGDADLIIDATDCFETRKIINKFCEENKRDWIYNGAIKSEAASCIFKGKNKDFKRIFPTKIIEERATDVGILPSATYLSASLGFNQVIKYFLDLESENDKHSCELIKINLWNNKIFEVKLKNN